MATPKPSAFSVVAQVEKGHGWLFPRTVSPSYTETVPVTTFTFQAEKGDTVPLETSLFLPGEIFLGLFCGPAQIHQRKWVGFSCYRGFIRLANLIRPGVAAGHEGLFSDA